jgi:hypothetical protein
MTVFNKHHDTLERHETMMGSAEAGLPSRSADGESSCRVRRIIVAFHGRRVRAV